RLAPQGKGPHSRPFYSLPDRWRRTKTGRGQVLVGSNSRGPTLTSRSEMSGDAVMPQLRSFGDGSLRWEDEMAGPVSRIIALGFASIAGTIVIAAANADGLPVLGLDVGPTGVATPSGGARYVPLP